MIDLVFNILNLLILFILLGYGFYKYFLPSVKKSFSQYKSNLNNLENTHKQLINDQEDIERKISLQKELCSNLRTKVNIWKQSIEDTKLKKAEIQSQLGAILKNKIDKQSENYKYEKVKSEIAPSVIENLTENLKKHFEETNNVELFFSNIFKELK